ncbi:DUF1254 domain-containing protein [Rhizobium leguminosarum]|jgi:hypothetical protein|uniref:DUF1254 domain-containing protein n=1 Tax=Rhizobium leguminosarum TaxID=384 RepID=UPI001C926D33|nr:DUF1254 domain-containing protein [Rhizobium leguminosarum]MBY2968115.1 DUF1254 domain-containing protein [Rhizobium leguminosarum]
MRQLSTFILGSILLGSAALLAAVPVSAQDQNPYGWLTTETLKTPSGEFEFKGGYPAGDSAPRLLDLRKLNLATEVYLTQLMPVSEIGLREGLRTFGATKPSQVVIWENLMDPKTVLLTANTETVYALSHLDLKAYGATVVEAPPKMLGFLQDGLQRYVSDVGPLGPDKGKGGKFLVLPPGYKGKVPKGYFVARSPTYSVTLGLRGFQVEGKTDEAVALMKQIKVYPLGKASSAPKMEFLNGSGKDINTVFPDNFHYFELLAQLVEEEPADNFGPLERSMMQAIGIEKGKPFSPDGKMKDILSKAAQLGGAMARANTFASDAPNVFYYPDRKWQGIPEGMTYTFAKDGAPQIDARNNVYYMAAGNSPAMMAKNVGQGSQYLWTYRDADGNFLDGGKTYTLHVPANIPAKNFWSVVVYDALSRSELQTNQPLPSVSSYKDPIINADGTVDIAFGPEQPKEKSNWIQTVPGKGWFPIFRFYGPSEPYFDKTWKLEDIVVRK